MNDLKNFRFLVIGLGSMGRRRIRNLLANGVIRENIFGYNISPKRAKDVAEEFNIKSTTTFKTAIKSFKPNVFVISTPPDQHKKYFLYAAKKGIHFFIEHPISDSGYTELFSLSKKSVVAAPSCTLRYHPAIKKIKKIVDAKDIGDVLTFQYHLGQYLPDWHPWEDYRKVYFSKKKTGACREMFTFELGWLSYILHTEVKTVRGVTTKVSALDMTADDVYSAILEFKNRIIGSIVIDLISRTAFRTLRLVGTKGIIDWEWQRNQIKVFRVTSKKWQTTNLVKGKSEKEYVTTEDMYEEELGVFLDSISGKKKYPISVKENHEFLKVLYALEKSNITKKTVAV